MYNETCCREHGVSEDCMTLCENPDGCCSTEREYMDRKEGSREYGWYNRFAIQRGVCKKYKGIIRGKCVIEIPQKQGI